MLEIEMSSDIQNIEPKIIGPLTFRQIVCLGISLAYGAPIFAIVPGDILVRIMVSLAFMTPTLLCGWIKVFNEPLEKFCYKAILNTFVKPQKRKYKCENSYEAYTGVEKKIKKVKRTKQNKGIR